MRGDKQEMLVLNDEKQVMEKRERAREREREREGGKDELLRDNGINILFNTRLVWIHQLNPLNHQLCYGRTIHYP